MELQNSNLIKEIENFYIPEELVKAIFRLGHIPKDSQETQVGVAFLDIANYTTLSKFLSPKENQILLNGLYTAFKRVIEQRGGFLNKIEGDAVMFHFEGILNAELKNKNENEKIAIIARALFFTCIDLQRVCVLFNQADENFLIHHNFAEDREALEAAFDIIKTLREKEEISKSLTAFFQIRVRIGANLGEVTIGNFGPKGHKHWDIIGLPVIKAKRMESTAPVGGLRISEDFFNLLEAHGITDEYFIKFRNEAQIEKGVYGEITKEELFKFKEVIVVDKQHAIYPTYAIQVFPLLPESIAHQAEALLHHGEIGTKEIIEFFRYYRGNKYIIGLLEQSLCAKGVKFRMKELIKTINFCSRGLLVINDVTNLYELFLNMDIWLDALKKEQDISKPSQFLSYDQFMDSYRKETIKTYKKNAAQETWKNQFAQIAVPLIYGSIEAAIREWQLKYTAEETLEEI